MTSRDIDINGYITVEKNPISRAGVFPYLGRNIDPSLDPDKIYNVLRPEEELSDPEAMKSFALIPLVDDHTMLGEGYTPAEEKGQHGTTGENLIFEDGVLYAPLRITSETMKRRIDSGKKDLSLGYRVGEWEKKSGVWNGQEYDYIQRDLRGNHIALVDQGRMGKGVAVLDHTFACDSFDVAAENEATQNKETPASEQASPTTDNIQDAGQQQGDKPMADEKDEKAVMGLKDVHDFVKDNKPMWDKLCDMMKPAADESEEDKKKAEEKAADKMAADKAAKDAETKETPGETKIGDEEDKEKKKAEDKVAMDAAIAAAVKRELSTQYPRVMKEMAVSAAERDKLAVQVAGVVGTFDHAEKTADEVAAYGLEKVGVKAPKGQEQGAWAGFMAGRQRQGVALAFDSGKSTSAGLIDQTLQNSK